MKIKSVCVFCGASELADEKYKKLAYECGRMIAERGFSLIYGGSTNGLMGKAAEGANSIKGRIIGIFPRFLSNFEKLSSELDHLILVDTMDARKAMMIQKADAFIILPGGFGTLDELFEIITLKILHQHDKPIIIVNYADYWAPLIALCQNIIVQKFAREGALDTFKVVDGLETAFKELEG